MECFIFPRMTCNGVLHLPPARSAMEKPNPSPKLHRISLRCHIRNLLHQIHRRSPSFVFDLWIGAEFEKQLRHAGLQVSGGHMQRR